MLSISKSTRFRIVGIEVVGLGVYNLLVLLLQLRESHGQVIVQSFGWDYAIIGGVLVAVGLELLSLVRYLPAQKAVSRPNLSREVPDIK